MNSDQSVNASGNVFSTMQDYVESEYFKENGKRCGARLPQRTADAKIERAVEDCTLSFTNIQGDYWPSVVYEVPVWWHVIYRSDGFGNVSDARIEAQMEALNEDYRAIAASMGANGNDVKIQFVLAGIDRIMNDEWFTDSYTDESAYKTSLAKDPNNYLNIYTNDASGYLGYAYFPQDSAGEWWDGIVLLHSAVGGRNNGFSPYDQGRTLVHEMGHYLGLFHTFQDGCTNSYSTGDLIVDTNAEQAANYDGSVPATSCGNLDPVHNYMNYVKDIYMWEFTQEQANRAVCSLVNYRPDLYSNAGTPSAWTLTVSKAGSGQGSVNSNPAGIACDDSCSTAYADFPINTPVTLTAAANNDSSFTGWSGGCSGTGECNVIMDQQHNVIAKFTKPFPWPTFLPAFTKNNHQGLTCKNIAGCYDGLFTDSCGGGSYTGRIHIEVTLDCFFTTFSNAGVSSQGSITAREGNLYSGIGNTDSSGCGAYSISCTENSPYLNCNYNYVGGGNGSIYNTAKGNCKSENRLKTEMLAGTWSYSYQIISVWTDYYRLDFDEVVESSATPDQYYIYGYDNYNQLVIGGYSPSLDKHTLLDTGTIIDKYFSFNFIGGGLVSGCYYQIDNSDNSWSDCYPMSGTQMSINRLMEAVDESEITSEQFQEFAQKNEVDLSQQNGVWKNKSLDIKVLNNYRLLKSNIR